MEVYATEFKGYIDDDLIFTVTAYDEGTSNIEFFAPIGLDEWDQVAANIKKCLFQMKQKPREDRVFDNESDGRIKDPTNII